MAARQNEVWLYGVVTSEPMILKSDDGEYREGRCYLAVMRSERYSGESWNKDKVMYDWPMIMSNDPAIVKQMEKCKLYDVVEVRGKLVMRKLQKQVFCPHCGKANRYGANLFYVMPTTLRDRTPSNVINTNPMAYRQLMDNREFSNSIIIAGNLCRDVVYYKDDRIETSVYQIAVGRRVHVAGDPPEVRDDFPLVRSFGENARRDHLCLQTGSGVLISGYLHSKQFKRKSMCATCNEDFEWTDETIEIIPYSEDYTGNYKDPEIAKQEEAARMQEEGERLKNVLTSQP